MMGFDRRYLLWGLSYVAAGMGLGIFMAASHDHVQHITHAHINLVGFVVSLIYGVIHKLWLDDKTPGLAWGQFIMHQTGAVTMFAGLFLLYGEVLSEAQLEPILSLATISVLLGALLMLFMVLKAGAVKA